MRTVTLFTLFAVVLLAATSLIDTLAWAAATINGHIEPAGVLEYGDRATLGLDISTSPVFGNEYVDPDGKFVFDLKVTLRLVGQSDVEPRPYGQGGLAIAPETDHFPYDYEIPLNLTVGKWLVNATVYQQMEHGWQAVDMSPDRWEFDVVQELPQPPPEKGMFQQMLESTYTIPAIVIGGSIVTVFGYLLAKRSKKRREPDPNRPVFHWEWFEEHVQQPHKVAKIRIFLREKHAARARVFMEGSQLTWERSGNKEFNMTAGDAGNLIIPLHLVSLDSKVSLRWGKNFSMKATLREIPKVNQ